MIHVRVLHSFEEAQPFREQMANLNQASARKSPFSTLEFFENYYEHDEYFANGPKPELWLLMAFEGDRLKGYLALRRVLETVLGKPSGKLEFLATHDTDRPSVVAAAGEEAACAQAFMRYLMEERKDAWGFLQLVQQDASSLFQAPDSGRYFARHVENLPNNTIPVKWSSADGYLSALPKKYRDNIKRQIRGVLDAGDVRYLTSVDPAGTPTLLDLYLGIERRSWKSKAEATICRHPERIRYFQGLLNARQRFQVGLGILVLDGVPIAGSIFGAYEQRHYALQLVYDEAYGRLSPGSLLLFMMVKRAIDEKHECLNMMSGFSYYKHRWLAESTDTRCLQVFRVGQRHFYKAILGDFRRRIEQPANTGSEEVNFNVTRRQVEEVAGTPEAREIPPAEREALKAQVNAAAQLPILSFNTQALMALMPFNADRGGRALP